MNNQKRLYLSRTDKKLGGVCGGIATYFGVDPTIIRLLWVVFGLMAFTGVIAYIIAMFVIPPEPV